MCLLAGRGLAGFMALLEEHRRAARIVAVTVGLGLLILTASSVRVIGGGHEQPAGLAATTAGRDCVWINDGAALIEADLSGNQISRGCPMFVDRYASAVDEVSTVDGPLDAALPSATRYQSAVAEHLDGSDLVLITPRELTGLSPATLAVLHDRFTHTGDLGRYQIWTLTP